MELTVTNRSQAYPKEREGNKVKGVGYYVLYVVLKVYYLLYNGPVAQLVRASPCHGEGREFESLLGR